VVVVAASVITRHAGRAALTGTAEDWAFVFPSDAMVIATIISSSTGGNHRCDARLVQ
jgi:hypothetical protein